MVLDQSNLPIFTWTPTYQQAGTYNTTFTVTDGTSSDTKTITITSSFIDTDHNGLPDTWERQYFGATGQDPNADPDADGLTNIEESKAGTDPTINSNIALGKTYTLDPAPNYSLCTGASDTTDLTDGVFTYTSSTDSSVMWDNQLSVAWANIASSSITIDLGSDQPISTIKYSTVSDATNGVFWPSSINVLASTDDVNYYFVTDMMKDDPNIPPVPTTGYHTKYRITACGLRQ